MGPDQGSSGPFQGTGEYPPFLSLLPPDHTDGPNKCKCMQNWSATGIMPLPLSQTPMTVPKNQRALLSFESYTLQAMRRRTECQTIVPSGKAQHTGTS